MGTFSVFALILTSGYIIYFLVMVARDTLAARGREDESDSVETLDTSFMDEQTVRVEVEEPVRIEIPIKEEQTQPDVPPLLETMGNLALLRTEYECAMDDVELENELLNGDCRQSGIVRTVIKAEGATEEGEDRDEM